ncbi:hypothetical protein Ancab_034966 [Ancistrocladus abbreviatus]
MESGESESSEGLENLCGSVPPACLIEVKGTAFGIGNFGVDLTALWTSDGTMFLSMSSASYFLHLRMVAQAEVRTNLADVFCVGLMEASSLLNPQVWVLVESLDDCGSVRKAITEDYVGFASKHESGELMASLWIQGHSFSSGCCCLFYSSTGSCSIVSDPRLGFPTQKFIIPVWNQLLVDFDYSPRHSGSIAADAIKNNCGHWTTHIYVTTLQRWHVFLISITLLQDIEELQQDLKAETSDWIFARVKGL